ncbi:MAG TPA: hypothetical protein VIH90_08005 [Candidatus Saccharimonadales bacterium]
MVDKIIAKKPDTVSLFRLRLGVVFIMFWWIPVYLAVPGIVSGLGLSNSAHATQAVLIIVITVQTIFGVIGFLLVGKSLGSNLKKVSPRKAPKVFWRMLWSGTTEIPDSDLRKKKPAKDNSKKPRHFWNHKQTK